MSDRLMNHQDEQGRATGEVPMTNTERAMAAAGFASSRSSQPERTESRPLARSIAPAIDQLKGALRSALSPDAYIDSLTQEQLVRLHHRMLEAVEAASKSQNAALGPAVSLGNKANKE
jgi:hypothetical protein